MKYFILILSILASNIIYANEIKAEPKVDNKEEVKIISNNENISLSFEKIEIPQLIELVYSDVLKISYIMHDDVLKKINHVTIRLKSNHKRSELPQIMSNLLQDYGISIDKKDKYISFRLTESKEEKKIPMFYKPKHRSTAYLISMLSGTIDTKDSIGQKRNADQSNKDKKNESEEGLNKLVTKEGDGILIMTTQKKIDLIMRLLKEIDIAEKQVHIQALVYEVSSANNESNAIQAVLKTIGKLGINMSVGASRGAGQIFEVSTKDLNIW